MIKNIVLEKALGFTKREAVEFVEKMKRVGLIPADAQIAFATVPGSGGGYPVSTAGARYLVRDRKETR